MPLHRFFLVVLLAGPLSFSGSALAQEGGGRDGARELALGREAAARGSYEEAAGHLSRAVQMLDGEALADAYLWAALAAEKLGQADVAARLEAAAMAAVAPAPALAPVETAAPVPSPKPDAFQYFFGEKEKKEPARAKADKAEGEAKPAEVPAKGKEAEGKAEEVDAFQYFFGKKKQKPAEKPADPPAS